MAEHLSAGDGSPQNERGYQDLVTLDELETLLEDLQDALEEAGPGAAPLPNELTMRLAEAGTSDIESLRSLIATLHRRLDQDD